MQFEAQEKANGHSAVSHAATARADEASMGKHTPLVKVSSEVRMLWRPFSHWCGGQMPRKSKRSGFAGSVRLPKGCKQEEASSRDHRQRTALGQTYESEMQPGRALIVTPASRHG